MVDGLPNSNLPTNLGVAMAFDSRCLELAEYFMPRADETKKANLAQAIQDVVEGFIEVEGDD